MVSMFVLRFYLFDQIKETVSAHLSRLRTWRCQEQEKWKVRVVVGEEPNFRTSSEFIYVEETKQLMQKEGQGTFFFNFSKIFISDRLLQQIWSGEEMEHPEMVKLKTWSCWSGTEKQVKVKRRGGKLKCWKCVYKTRSREWSGGGSRRIRTLCQQTFECCHKTVLHYKVCTVHIR